MNPVGATVGLDQLRGLHLPGDAAGSARAEIVSALALGFLAALLVGLARHLRHRRQRTVRRTALDELAAARGLGTDERLVAQARLLRRLTRTLRGDEAAASRGTRWAAELDALLRTDFFTAGTGRVFVEGLYARRVPKNLDAIDAELARLIGQMRP